MGGRAEGLACADPEARTPIGAGGNFSLLLMGAEHLVVRSSIHPKFGSFLPNKADEHRNNTNYIHVFWIGMVTEEILWALKGCGVNN